MDNVKDAVSSLVQILEALQKKTGGRVQIMHEMQTYLVEESKSAVNVGLDRLASRINAESAEITRGTAVVVLSPVGRVTLKKTRTDKEIDPYLRRLQSQDFQVLTLSEFSHIIESVKSQVKKGNLTPVIRFLMVNSKTRPTWTYSQAPTLKTRRINEISPLPQESPNRQTSPSKWNLSDFLPASFPLPPLPRGFFQG